MIHKSKYKVCNWHQYNESLANIGRINLWIDQCTLDHRLNPDASDNGQFTPKYSDACIECGIRIKAMYNLPWRAVQGLLESIIEICQIDLDVPHYSTFYRRQR